MKSLISVYSKWRLLLKPTPDDDNAFWNIWSRFNFLCDTGRFQKIVSHIELVRDHMKTSDANAFDQQSDAIQRIGLAHRMELVRGDITETLPRHLNENRSLQNRLLHCDLDMYPATLSTWHHARPSVPPDEMLAFDEYAAGGWGESDVVDKFIADRSVVLG